MEVGILILKIRLDGSSNPNNYNYITGTDQSETLVGTKHDDVISGRKGDDYIYAEDGDDIIILSEAGKETFDGGEVMTH